MVLRRAGDAEDLRDVVGITTSVDNRVPDLLRARFDREWHSFLRSDTARAFESVLAKHGVSNLRIWTELIFQYVTSDDLAPRNKNFERALLGVGKQTVVNGQRLDLAIEDASGLNAASHASGGTRLHDAGGRDLVRAGPDSKARAGFARRTPGIGARRGPAGEETRRGTKKMEHSNNAAEGVIESAERR